MGATGLYIRTADMVKLGWVYAKGGMFGQLLCFSVKHREAYAWHAYEKRNYNGNAYLSKLFDRPDSCL